MVRILTPAHNSDGPNLPYNFSTGSHTELASRYGLQLPLAAKPGRGRETPAPNRTISDRGGLSHRYRHTILAGHTPHFHLYRHLFARRHLLRYSSVDLNNPRHH